MKAPEQPSQLQDSGSSFGESQLPSAGRHGAPEPRTESFDLALEHWKFLLRVLYVFVGLFIAFMLTYYVAQWLKLPTILEFKDFAQYIIPLFAFLFGMGRSR